MKRKTDTLELSDDDLLAELGVPVASPAATGHTPREERILAGFEDIQRFFLEHGRVPVHGKGGDIFERIYATRLDRIRAMPEARELLSTLDRGGLLAEPTDLHEFSPEALDDAALLAELDTGVTSNEDMSVLRHVSSREERRVAEEIANRAPAADFARFKPLFEQVESDLAAGTRRARPFGRDASVALGDFFILGGQVVYVAEMGEAIKAPNGESDARLRVIYSNGTESNLLRRSLQRALYKDDAGRRLTDPNTGPLFSEIWGDDDIESGTIYVLRSLSNHPFVAQHRELVHKIGVTGGKVETRICDAAQDPTYLLAEVEIVATYKLADLNRTKLERLFHRIFSPGQLDLTIPDRFGHPVRPQEWFLVPLQVIDEAVQRIRDGSIEGMAYDPESARLVRR